nr:astacin-like metalloprotease toxin 5 [Rhipicephalus microplus]
MGLPCGGVVGKCARCIMGGVVEVEWGTRHLVKMDVPTYSGPFTATLIPEGHHIDGLSFRSPDVTQSPDAPDAIALAASLRSPRRNAVATGKQLWPGGVIPYTVDMFFRQEGKMNHVRQWMNTVEYLTCLRFVERTWEEHYIHIYSGIGCYSYVGRIGGQQALSLGRECLYEGTVVHELLHAAGFYHMHSRPDRDEYLDILWNNIDPEYIDHFDKYSAEDVDSMLPFDTKSVMLYSADAFALHPGLMTMKCQ